MSTRLLQENISGKMPALMPLLMPAFITLFSLIPFAVSAQIAVDFTPDPLFSESNGLPGDSLSGTVMLTNGSDEPQTIITEAINVLDPAGLSGQMTFTIDDGVTTFFDGTFMDFLTGGEEILTDPLPAGESVTYTYTLTFLESAGNEYQEKMLGFDLCVGYFDVEGLACGDTVISEEGNTDENGATEDDDGGAIGGGGGGGGGLPVANPILAISNIAVTAIDPDGGTATIEWDTNLYSTSQVVFGLASGGPYSLSLTPPLFGYPSATVEDGMKVLHHSVGLTGLQTGEFYNFRVVSRASPPTVSFEHGFVVEEFPAPVASPPADNSSDISEGGSNIIALGGGSSGGSGSSSSNGSSGVEPFQTGEEAGTTTATTTDDRRAELEELAESLNDGDDVTNGEESGNDLPLADPGLLAAGAIFGSFLGDEFKCLDYILYVLIIVLIVYLLYRAIARRKYSPKVGVLLWYIGLLTGSVYMLVRADLCAFLGLLIILAALAVTNYYKSTQSEQEYEGRQRDIINPRIEN